MLKLKSRLLNALLLSLLFAVAAVSINPARADDSAKLPQLVSSARSAKVVGPPVQYLLWKNTSGQYSLWALDANNQYNYFFYGPNANWTVTDFKAGYDGDPRMLWTNTNREQSLYDIDPTGTSAGSFTYDLLGPYPNWTVKSFAPDTSNHEQLLWQNIDGDASLWNFTPATTSTASSKTYFQYSVPSNWSASEVSIGPNGDPMLLWQRSDNLTAVWTVNPSDSGHFTYNSYGPYTNAGWTSRYMATGIDGITRLVWTNTDGRISLWKITNKPEPGGYSYYVYAPTQPLTLKGLTVDGNLDPRLFFETSTGAAQIWTVNPANGEYKYIQFGPYPNYTPEFYDVVYDSGTIALP